MEVRSREIVNLKGEGCAVQASDLYLKPEGQEEKRT